MPNSLPERARVGETHLSVQKNVCALTPSPTIMYLKEQKKQLEDKELALDPAETGELIPMDE